jgi:hypothetical protein
LEGKGAANGGGLGRWTLISSYGQVAFGRHNPRCLQSHIRYSDGAALFSPLPAQLRRIGEIL